jgi:uncharacterized membrane protein YfcA
VPDALEVAVVAAAVFVGSALNAFAGFGFALVTVPLMAAVVGPRDAVVLSAITGLVSNGGVAIRHRGDRDRPVTARVIAGSMAGMPVGLVVLVNLPEDPLKVLIGAVAIVAVGLLATGWRLHDPHPLTDVVAGFASGCLNTSVGISGPPVVALMQGRGFPKAVFRASSAMVFLVAGVVALGLFGIAGQCTRAVFVTAAFAVLAVPLGWWTGGAAHRRVPEDRFRTLVLVLLAVTAGVAILSVVI